MKPVAVLAGTFAEFQEWQIQNPGKRGIYACSYESIAGLEFDGLVIVGSFRHREDAEEIASRVWHRVR